MKVHRSPADALRELPEPTEPLLVIVPDSTRPIDLKSALHAVQLWSGGRVSAVHVGLGLHRRSTESELSVLRKACSWTVVDHDPDDCVELGALDGAPIEVSRAVGEAKRILTIGRIELHQYAGFSGGYKGVVVGCGGRSLIEALHDRQMVTQPGVRVGELTDNPFRTLIDRIGQQLPSTTALQWLPDHGWMAGDPSKVLAVAAKISKAFFPSPKPVDRVLVDLPNSKAVNFYQASRGATYLALSPRPPLFPGAQIVLEAACPEGIGLGSGEANFANALRSCPPPWTPLLTEPIAFGGGSQRAVMLALLAQKYRLVVTGCSNPSPLLELGVEAYKESASERFGTFELVVTNPFQQLPQLV